MNNKIIRGWFFFILLDNWTHFTIILHVKKLLIQLLQFAYFIFFLLLYWYTKSSFHISVRLCVSYKGIYSLALRKESRRRELRYRWVRELWYRCTLTAGAPSMHASYPAVVIQFLLSLVIQLMRKQWQRR